MPDIQPAHRLEGKTLPARTHVCVQKQSATADPPHNSSSYAACLCVHWLGHNIYCSYWLTGHSIAAYWHEHGVHDLSLSFRVFAQLSGQGDPQEEQAVLLTHLKFMCGGIAFWTL
eukprot:scaffold77456_cov19-Tisochrysis_lutea.AAC.2